jgi:hypothetical protein
MNLITGEKEYLALEFVPAKGSYTLGDGRFFLYVSDVKIGDEEDTYDYYSSVLNVAGCYKKRSQKFPELFDLPSDELLPALVRVMEWEEDFPDIKNRKLSKKMRELIDNFSDLFEELTEHLFNHYVPYAFDGSLILVVPDGDRIMICAYNANTNAYAKHITTHEEFFGLWVEMKSKLEFARGVVNRDTQST